MKLYVVISDVHDRHPANASPFGRLCRKVYHPAYRCVEKVIKAYQPHGIVNIGDMTDMDSLCRFNLDKRKKMENKRYWKDIDSLNHLLDRQCELSPKAEKIYIMGNHEDWVNQYLEYHPEMSADRDSGHGGIDFVRDTQLKERGYEVIPLNGTKRLGKALFMHGLYTNLHHAYKTSQVYPKTIFYGHSHDVQTHSFTSPIDQKDVRVAECMGCLCDLNPSWMRNKPNKWVHAFGMFWLKDNGEFQMDRKIVIKDEAVVNGKIFKG